MPVDVDAEVLSNTCLSADYNVLALEAPALAASAEPGQFVMLKPPGGDSLLLRRPYSVFEIIRNATGAPRGLTILSKRVGAGSALLYAARPGDRVRTLGPLGRAFTLIDPPAHAFMVAGGVGLAPFATLAEALHLRGVRSTLFYGARTAAELFCLDLFERLGVRLILATEDGSRGVHGRVTVPLDSELASASPTEVIQVYACGPDKMLEAVAGVSGAHRRPSELSMERLMGCGMGGCYSCVVKMRDPSGQTRYVRSCVEGPVLPGADIVWDA